MSTSAEGPLGHTLVSVDISVQNSPNWCGTFCQSYQGLPVPELLEHLHEGMTGGG